MKWLLVAFGGAAGAVLRYAVTTMVMTWTTVGFPMGTFLVNMAGCMAIGMLWGMGMDKTFSPVLTAFIFPGLLGGFTTFSAFSLESLQLMRTGQPGMALIYVIASIAGGLLAAWTGLRLSGHTLLG